VTALAWQAAAQAASAEVGPLLALVSRLAPICFLCPVLGGPFSPSIVRLALALSWAGLLRFGGGVGEGLAVDGLWPLLGLVFRELAFGVAIGLLASLPLDAARMGGRFIDLFRGSSAEAALPMAGSRETASGDALYQLTIALVAATGVMPLLLSAASRSFLLVPLGGAVLDDRLVEQVLALLGTALGTALAIGAPIAAVGLAIDGLTGLVGRILPQLHLQETATPIRLLAGGAVFWLALGLIADRALAGVLHTTQVLSTLGVPP
jgi:type III secretion protein T